MTYQIADQERMTQAKNYFAWQARLVCRELGQRVLDFGCGLGNFTSQLLERELVVAYDPDAALLQRLRARYPNQPNLHVLEEEPAIANFRLDSCVCLNVLEHIEDDLATIERIAGWLTPGGRIALLLPAFPALYGRIDRNLGHARRYTRRRVAELADAGGLRVRKMHYVNCVGFFGWWVNAHILRRAAQSATQIRFFDRCIVPWLSRIEALVPPPFGQNLFVVLEKP